MYGIAYTNKETSLQVLRTNEFDKWLSKQPPKTRTIILARLDMRTVGHFGDYKRFEGLIELRWKNGIRAYTFIWNRFLVVALNGGNKNGQDHDIWTAKKIRKEIIEGARSIQKS